MQTLNGQLVYSATDLVGFLECRHLANLERAATEGHIKRPVRDDPVLDRIAQKGQDHEARFLADLAVDGVTVEESSRPTLLLKQRASRADATPR